MSRYRKTMRQAIEEGLSNMQVAILKKEYEPFRGKTISAARAKQLMNILDKFKEQDLQKLAKANIPFVSSGSDTKLRMRKMGFKVTTFNPMGSFKEEITQEDFDLVEGKMKTIATMFSQGKSAEEIAKKMGLDVKTVKSILGEVKEGTMIGGIVTDNSGKKMPGYDKAKKALKDFMSKPQPAKGASDKVISFIFDDELLDDLYVASKKNMSDVRPMVKKRLKALGIKEDLEEENIYEFKKMTVTIADPIKRKKAMDDIRRFGKGTGFDIQRLGSRSFRVDGKGADLNKFATDLKNFYGAEIQAECYTMDESADEDFYNPVTEACWTGYKQVGMKDKGGKKVPNCVPESVNEQDDSMTMAKDMKKKKEELPKKDDVAPDADTEKKESDNVEKLKKEVEKKDDEIAMLKTKAETEKAKVAKKETEKMVNPETGEPLLQVGVAYKHLRDKMAKEKVSEELNKDDEKVIKKVKDMLKGASAKHAAQAKMIDKALKSEADLSKSQIKKVHKMADELPKKDFKDRYGKEKGDAVRYATATNIVKKKLGIKESADTRELTNLYNKRTALTPAEKKRVAELEKKLGVNENMNKEHPAKELYETIAGLKKKAEKSGMPYSILKKVYDRGMAAWRGGHRPGTTQQQWAFARVNSFVTKSSGTWGGADKDLAKQVRGSK